MTVLNTVRVLPRIVIGGYVQAARLPLTAVQRLAHQQDNETWGPAIAFDSIEAQLETALGVVLRDDTLLTKGSVKAARVEELRKAATLDNVADIKVADAEAKRKARQAEIAEEREEAARRAEQSKADIERQAALHEQKVKEKAAKKAAAARKVKAAQNKAIDREERDAKSKALAAESRALTVAKEAVEVKEAATQTEAEIERSKQERTTG